MNVVTDQSEQLDQLARRVDDLIALTELLTNENRALRAQQQQGSQERAKLSEKNQTATTSVEAMIT
ncbi:MAG: TIGR02449 family protein, partial [Pseudomonadota bacterium]|nr:TIGR02449 family protein [Pseudomonadota bacterium]